MAFTAAISLLFRMPARFVRAAMIFCIGGRDTLLRVARARADLAELAVEKEKLQIEKDRILFLLDAAAKVGRLKDSDQREALETAIFKHHQPVKLELPRKLLPE